MRVSYGVRERAGRIGEKFERTAGGDGRVFLTQGTGGGIARVRKLLFLVLLILRIQSGEIGMRHVYLTPHFKNIGEILMGEMLRDVLYGANIRSYILTGGAIAPGRGMHEMTMFVTD